MRYVRVFRMEHKRVKWDNGYGEQYVGPFHSYAYSKIDDTINDEMCAPPPPRDWFDYNRAYLFACATKQALLDWFNPRIQEELKRIGFIVAVYEVPADKVQHCPHGIQCAFDLRHARKVKRRTWKDETTLDKLAA